MPWTAEYFEDGAEIRYHGLTTGPEIVQAKAEFFAHAFAKPARWVICDFSKVEQFQIAKADVEQLVRQDLRAAAANPQLAECIIASKPYEYGLARMWEMQVDAQEKRTNVARTRAECDAWMKKQGLR